MERGASERMPVERSQSALRDAARTAELAGLLKKFRVQAGLSQQTLAERALISVQAVSALERGFRKAPYRATLERIADALALSHDSSHRSSGATRSLRRSRIYSTCRPSSASSEPAEPGKRASPLRLERGR